MTEKQIQILQRGRDKRSLKCALSHIKMAQIGESLKVEHRFKLKELEQKLETVLLNFDLHTVALGFKPKKVGFTTSHEIYDL